MNRQTLYLHSAFHSLTRLCENSAARKIRKKKPPCNCVFANFRAAAAKIDLYAIRPKVFTQSVTLVATSKQTTVLSRRR